MLFFLPFHEFHTFPTRNISVCSFRFLYVSVGFLEIVACTNSSKWWLHFPQDIPPEVLITSPLALSEDAVRERTRLAWPAASLNRNLRSHISWPLLLRSFRLGWLHCWVKSFGRGMLIPHIFSPIDSLELLYHPHAHTSVVAMQQPIWFSKFRIQMIQNTIKSSAQWNGALLRQELHFACAHCGSFANSDEFHLNSLHSLHV